MQKEPVDNPLFGGPTNTLLDDISAVIGFTATQRIAVWYGGANLYVPSFAAENHQVGRMIGMARYRALVLNFGAKTLAIPGINQADLMHRRIAEMTVKGKTTQEIAMETGLSIRRIDQIKDVLRNWGVFSLAKAGRKGRWKMPPTNVDAHAPEELPADVIVNSETYGILTQLGKP